MLKFAMLGAVLLTAGPAFAQSLAPSSNTPAANAATPAAPPPKVPARSASSSQSADPEMVEARINQRIVQMHQRLKITPDQQPAWNTFAQRMRDNVTTIEQAYKERKASVATMSAPDNMRNFAALEQARAEDIQKLAAAFQTLYDGMSDDQKKSADAMFRHYEDHKAARKKAPR